MVRFCTIWQSRRWKSHYSYIKSINEYDTKKLLQERFCENGTIYQNHILYKVLCENLCRNHIYHPYEFFFIFWHDFLIQFEYFNAKNIIIEGGEKISEEEVLKQTNIHLGINILSVNLSKARKNLLSNPWIADARIARVLPSEIHIIINEHKPIAILDLGRKFILNDQGKIFKEWMPYDPDNLPLVVGLGFADIPSHSRSRIWNQNSHRGFDAVMDLLQMGKASENIIPNRFIKQIEVDREMGITLRLLQDENDKDYQLAAKKNIVLANGIRTIKLGYDNYPLKFDRLKKILLYLKGNPSKSPFGNGGKKGKFLYNKGLQDYKSFSKENRGIFNIDTIDINNLNRIIVNSEQLSVIGNYNLITDN